MNAINKRPLLQSRLHTLTLSPLDLAAKASFSKSSTLVFIAPCKRPHSGKQSEQKRFVLNCFQIQDGMEDLRALTVSIKALVGQGNQALVVLGTFGNGLLVVELY